MVCEESLTNAPRVNEGPTTNNFLAGCGLRVGTRHGDDLVMLVLGAGFDLVGAKPT